MPMHLRLEDFSDHDLLYALEDCGDDEGWATSKEIAEFIGLKENPEAKEYPAANVGIRLAWMFRFGVMEKRREDGVEIVPVQWRLNDTGYSLIHPTKLSPSAMKALEALDEGQRLLVTEAVSRQLKRTSRQGVHLARRAFTHNIGSWRDESIAAKKKAA